ncbi:hypothetical protein Gotur_024159 [Gossypium turneri]
MLGKLSSKRFTIMLKRRQEASKKSQLSRIQRSQQMELKLKLIQSQTLKRKNLIRNRTFLNQKFIDAIFETWTEDIDDASGDGAKEDKGNESEK